MVFAAGGNPVKREKDMRHLVSVEESRRILGLDTAENEELYNGSTKMSGLRIEQ